MALSSWLLLLLQLLTWVSAGLACFCERYPWGSWSACSATCNHGTQSRSRTFLYDDYYWKSSCKQMCQGQESRACNVQFCPINCLLTDFGPWSDCSPCAKKQFRTRFVQRPSQFGGSPCSEELTDERPCYPSTECKLAAIDCRGDFQCDNGRCINETLKCNRQNDCGDNSDERDCDSFTVVCPAERRPTPGSDLVGNGFDALAEEPRGAVLDNMFMGGACDIARPRQTVLYHRIPHNFETFDVKAAVVEDFSTEPRPLKVETVGISTSKSSQQSSPQRRRGSFFFLFPLPFFFYSGRSMMRESSKKEAFDASKTTDSKFFRVHQVLPVSTFKVKDPEDLVLSLPFLQFLHALPLDYNYALYREIFQRFGTHYYSSGTLGGHYDLLYQYSRQQLSSSGLTEERVKSCLSRDSTWTVILYTEHRRVSRCNDNRMTERYQGSFIQASEKSFSMVRGGRPREAGALAWKRQNVAPDQTAYKNWAKSVLDNPAVVENEGLPIIALVRGIPCAATKRRHLTKALLQYMEEFDTCKCAPCPNNARAVLSGTECQCVCQTGTYGTNCEIRAPDYTSVASDGYWSCWGPWSNCGSSMKRHRTRRCDNPAPLNGGKPCEGDSRQEDTCHISIFTKQESCDNDDDFTVGGRDELPPGVQGCLRPEKPANSFLRKAKPYYSFGEHEEFQCYTGFDLDGYQFINCLPDGTWSQPNGRCIRKVCLPPEIPVGMMLFPGKDEYKVGQSVGFSCNDIDLRPFPAGVYQCGESLTWEPALPADLRCTNEEPFVADGRCRPGEKMQGSQCVCIQRESCLSHPDSLCVLNADLGVIVSMSLCSFHAGRCHNDPLFFVYNDVCDEAGEINLELAVFRANMSSKSTAQVPCGLDTCYEWETCSVLEKCDCRAARDCPKGNGAQMFCVKLTRTQRIRSLDLCSLGALKCSNYQFEILNEGACESR